MTTPPLLHATDWADLNGGDIPNHILQDLSTRHAKGTLTPTEAWLITALHLEATA